MTITRREMLGLGAFLGAAGVASAPLVRFQQWVGEIRRPARESGVPGYHGRFPAMSPEAQVPGLCTGCPAACPIRVWTFDGKPARVDGNPLSPMHHLGDEPVGPEALSRLEGKLCARGQMNHQVSCDPWRLVKVLKRAGPRGSGQWVTIPFATAVEEILAGGALFASAGDPHKIGGLGELAAEREELIDPEKPALGRRGAGLVLVADDRQADRRYLPETFFAAFGSPNLCLPAGPPAPRVLDHLVAGEGWRFRPLFEEAEAWVCWGSNPLASGPDQMAATHAIGQRGLPGEVWVIDPRRSESVLGTGIWLPVRPAADGALAMAMAASLVRSDSFDRAAITAANEAAARELGLVGRSELSQLFWVDGSGAPVAAVDGEELGLGSGLAVLVEGRPTAVLGYDGPLTADLEGEIERAGRRARTAWDILVGELLAVEPATLADRAGLTQVTIDQLAGRWAEARGRIAFSIGGGVYRQPGGSSTALSIRLLATLLGVGLRPGGTQLMRTHSWRGAAGPPATRAGVPLSREGSSYADGPSFAGYPAPVPWFPLGRDLAQATLQGVAAGSPYPTRVLLTVGGAGMFGSPLQDQLTEALSDPDRVPLHVAIDTALSECSSLADYVFPDVTNLERFGFAPANPNHPGFLPLAQPAMAAPTPTASVFGKQQPVGLETLLLALAEALELEGFGAAAGIQSSADLALKVLEETAAALPQTPLTEPEATVLSARLRGIGEAVHPGGQWLAAGSSSVAGPLYRGGFFVPERVDGALPVLSPLPPSVLGLRHGRDGSPIGVLPHAGNTEHRGGHSLGLVLFREPFGGWPDSAALSFGQASMRWEAGLVVSHEDAEHLGLGEHDRLAVGIESLEGEMTGVELKIGPVVAPGVVGLARGYGHTALHASPVVVDGVTIPADESRGRGASISPLVQVWDAFSCLDPITGESIDQGHRIWLRSLGPPKRPSLSTLLRPGGLRPLPEDIDG